MHNETDNEKKRAAKGAPNQYKPSTISVYTKANFSEKCNIVNMHCSLEEINTTSRTKRNQYTWNQFSFAQHMECDNHCLLYGHHSRLRHTGQLC